MRSLISRGVVAVATIAVLAGAGGCSAGETEKPVGPEPGRTSGAPAPQGPPPLSRVVLGTQDLAVALMAQRGNAGGLPLSLRVENGSVLDVKVGEGVEVDQYRVFADQGVPAVRFCLVHESGAWSAFDSQVGELVTALSGDCVFRLKDLPAPKQGQLDHHDVPEFKPTSLEELSWLLTSEVLRVGKKLDAADKLPGDLDTLLSSDVGKPLNPEVAVSGFQVYPSAKGKGSEYVVCVDGAAGGWARLDSRQPDAPLFGVEATCDTTQGELLNTGT